MKRKMILRSLVMLVLGLAVCWLYRQTFTHIDESGLLIRGTLPETALWLVTAAALLLSLLGAGIRLDAPAAIPGAMGDAALAVGIYTMIQFYMPGNRVTGMVYQAASAAAIVCLVISAGMRLMRKKPFFVLDLVVCLYLLLQIVGLYQTFSKDPLILNHCFILLAAGCLLLFSYHRMAQGVQLPDSRMHGILCLAGIFCCTAAIMQGAPFFYAAAAVWLLAGANAKEA